MTARAALAEILYTDQAMEDLGYSSANVFSSNAVDTPTQLKQFIVITDEGTEKTFGTTGPVTVNYWVHLSRQLGADYSDIDLALLRIRELLVGAVQYAGTDGWVLTGASWVDQSRDLSDDVFNTITKFTTFRAAMRNMITE